MEKALLCMISEIDRKRRLLEAECDMLKELLKPWPKQKSEAAKVTSEASCQKEPEKKAGDSLSREEQEALVTVEKLLQKAQITRQVKTKHKSQVVRQAGCSSEKNDLTDDPQSTPELLGSGDKESHNAHLLGPDTPQLSMRPVHSGDTNTSHNQRNRRSVASTKVNKGASHTQSSQAQAVDKNLSDRNKQVAISSQSLRPSSQTRIPTSRPASGKNRYTPAHMSAPFKTENTKMPGRRVNQALKLPRHSVSQPRPDSGLNCPSYRTLPAIKGGTSTTVKDSSRDNVKVSDQSPRGDEGSSLPGPDNSTRAWTSYLSSSSDHLNKLEDAGMYVCEDPSPSLVDQQAIERRSEGTSLSVGEGHSYVFRPSEMTDTEIKPEVEQFTLKRNGAGLKIPGKLAKLVSVNNSLREQCSAARLLKRVSPSDSGQLFVERLQGEWEISEELWTRVRALTCLRAHTRLLEMFQGLNLPQLSAQSSYQELYKGKRMLEFVLSMFASLQDESNYLSQVQFRNLDLTSMEYTTSQECDVTSAVHSDSPAVCGDKAVEQRLRGCEEWTRLKFTEKYLNTQLWLSELVKSEWWSSLSADSCDPAILQTLCSLVSSGGQFLPALVKN